MFAWQATVQNEKGDVVILPSVTVYDESGAIASIYDETGAPLPNPFVGTMEGFVQFWAYAGKYEIEGASGSDRTETWSVTLGLNEVQSGYAAAVSFSASSGFSVISAAINDIEIKWIRDVSGTCLGGGWSPLGDAYPEHFGATGDGVTLEQTQMQEWADFIRVNGRSGRLNSRTYVVTSLEMMPSKFYSIEGDNFQLSGILIRNTERTGVGLNFGHVDGNTRPPAGVRIDNIRVRAGSGTKACLVQFARSIDLQVFRLKISGFHGATGIRHYGLWNCDFKEVTVYGCGHNIPSRTIPNGATFNISVGSNTLTSNIDVFNSGMVGLNITLLNGSQSGGQRHVITAYNNARSVTVQGAHVGQSIVDGFATFGGIRAQAASGSNTITFGRALDQDDVGRVVYVLDAGKIAGNSGPVPLRAVITSVSGQTATVNKVATYTTGFVEVAFDPAVDGGDPDEDLVNGKTNDATFTDLHIELHAGCGLVVHGARVYFNNLKLHSYGMSATTGLNQFATNIQALIYDANVSMNGAFEQAVCGGLSRIVCSRVKGAQISYAETVGIAGLPLIQQYNGSSSPIDIGTITFYGNSADEVFNGMIGPGWFNQYGTTSSAVRSGVAKRHGTPGLITYP